MRRWMPWIAAAAITLISVSLWQHHARQAQEKAARREAWLAYLHGPLPDLLYGSSRLRPLVVKKRLNKAELQEAKEAADALERSRVVVPRIKAQLVDDPSMAGLSAVVTWHQEIGHLMEHWIGLVGKPLGKDAVATEAEMRLRLWQVLNQLRDRILADDTLSKDEILEMNALLYTLKEETGAQNGQ